MTCPSHRSGFVWITLARWLSIICRRLPRVFPDSASTGICLPGQPIPDDTGTWYTRFSPVSSFQPCAHTCPHNPEARRYDCQKTYYMGHYRIRLHSSTAVPLWERTGPTFSNPSRFNCVSICFLVSVSGIRDVQGHSCRIHIPVFPPVIIPLPIYPTARTNFDNRTPSLFLRNRTVVWIFRPFQLTQTGWKFPICSP
jgi:hypothetical protein